MNKNLDIRADERNYRMHGDKNKALIRKSLEDCGAGRSIVVDNTGATIGGAGVLEQADAMGIPKRIVETDGSELVVVVRKDIAPDDPRRRALAIADNATTDLSEWDVEKLQQDFGAGELAEMGVDIPCSISDEELEEKTDSYVISYELVFNNEDEQKVWFDFLKAIKSEYADMTTISERIICAVKEWMDGR